MPTAGREARGGFAPSAPAAALAVEIPPEWERLVPEDRRAGPAGHPGQDPRPPYQHDPQRTYGLVFAGLEIRFQVREAHS